MGQDGGEGWSRSGARVADESRVSSKRSDGSFSRLSRAGETACREKTWLSPTKSSRMKCQVALTESRPPPEQDDELTHHNRLLEKTSLELVKMSTRGQGFGGDHSLCTTVRVQTAPPGASESHLEKDELTPCLA